MLRYLQGLLSVQEEPRKLAPVYFPVTRQQDFPMSRQTACAMVQNLLQHPNASTPFPAHLAASGHKRELPEPDQARSGRFFMPFAGAPRPVLPSAAPNGQGAALPDKEAPGMWSVQVWPAPPNCAMG